MIDENRWYDFRYDLSYLHRSREVNSGANKDVFINTYGAKHNKSLY